MHRLRATLLLALAATATGLKLGLNRPKPISLPSGGAASKSLEAPPSPGSYEFSAVALGFAVHAIVQAVEIIFFVLIHGNARHILRLGGCLDEAFYGYCIWAASGHFNVIATTRGRDIENLMDGVDEQTRLWRRMRRPLFVKSGIMLLELLYSLNENRCNSAARAAIGAAPNWFVPDTARAALLSLLDAAGATGAS